MLDTIKTPLESTTVSSTTCTENPSCRRPTEAETGDRPSTWRSTFLGLTNVGFGLASPHLFDLVLPSLSLFAVHFPVRTTPKSRPCVSALLQLSNLLQLLMLTGPTTSSAAAPKKPTITLGPNGSNLDDERAPLIAGQDGATRSSTDPAGEGATVRERLGGLFAYHVSLDPTQHDASLSFSLHLDCLYSLQSYPSPSRGLPPLFSPFALLDFLCSGF